MSHDTEEWCKIWKKTTDSLMRAMFLDCLSVSYDYEISCISKLLRYNENEVLEVSLARHHFVLVTLEMP